MFHRRTKLVLWVLGFMLPMMIQCVWRLPRPCLLSPVRGVSDSVSKKGDASMICDSISGSLVSNVALVKGRGGATVGSMGSRDLLDAMKISLEVPWSCWCDLVELHAKWSTK
ncbi:hypothetical protein Pyn_25003 [Prunus yedoensis var. nudiflora]|uniref:Secreted protein n=1 Tax=Prunus yedoensis var. nudiflora TaxID=2094558 RepID=A0A314YKA7_PRUYE|nr:hypothetical protein Pyn_25003 [Prunus yedoensis var. nudiflora]